MVVARRNLEDLRNPVHVTDFFSTETVSDHNQYVLGDHVYQSNYMAGLRILHADQSDAVPHLTETGFFDGESRACSLPSAEVCFGDLLGFAVQVSKVLIKWLGIRCANV